MVSLQCITVPLSIIPKKTKNFCSISERKVKHRCFKNRTTPWQGLNQHFWVIEFLDWPIPEKINIFFINLSLSFFAKHAWHNSHRKNIPSFHSLRSEPLGPWSPLGVHTKKKKETLHFYSLTTSTNHCGQRGDFMIKTPQVPQVQSVSAIPYPDLYRHQGHNKIS